VRRLGGVVGNEIEGVVDRPRNDVVDQFIKRRSVGGDPAAGDRTDRSRPNVPGREAAAARDRPGISIHDRHLSEQVTIELSEWDRRET